MGRSIFKHFLTSANEGNAFIVACAETKEALLVDVGAFELAMARFIEEQGLRLAKVFITHDHYDHTGGLQEVLDRYAPEVLGFFITGWRLRGHSASGTAMK